MQQFKRTGGRPTLQTRFPDDSPAQASFFDPFFYPDSQDPFADPGSPSFGPDATIAEPSPGAGATVLGGDSTTGTATAGTTSSTSDTTTMSGGAVSAGLVINVTYDASVASAPAGFTSDVAAVVQYFESHFNDPITINIDVGFGEVNGQTLGGGALGSSRYYLNSYTYSQVKSALTADATSGTDAAAVATLPTSDPTNGGTYWMTTAEAKALGLASGSSLDGYVGFGSAANLFDYNNSDGVTAGQYDFMGTVAHEISEVLGRQTADGQNIAGTIGYTPLDLFHYSAPGTRDLSGTQAGYFSANGGVTNLNNFNTSTGGDFGDWAGSAGNDAFRAFASSGVVMSVTAADLTLMDVIGWNAAQSATAVTEHLASDTGVSATDNITSNDTLTGTGAANAVVTLTEGTATLGAVTADSTGAWSFTPAGLADGTHTIMAAESIGSTSLSFSLDTAAPSAPVILGDTTDATGQATVNGTAEANSTISLFDGATKLGTTLTNVSGAWSYTTGVLAAGTHVFTTTAMDAAGNISAVSNAVDPIITPTAPAAPAIASFSPNSDIVGGINLANALTLTGSAEANSTVNLFDGATHIGAAMASSSGAWSFATAALANGAHSFTATDTDAAGTSAASAALAVTIGAPALAVAFTGLVANSNGGATLSGTAEANSTISIYDGVNPAALGTVAAGSNGGWSFTSAALANAVHSFTAIASDSAGNIGSSSGVALRGTTGNDTLASTSGQDIFAGNGGTDTFVFGATFGKDVVADFQPKGAAHDTLQFSNADFSSFASVLAHTAQFGANAVITLDANDSVTLQNVKVGSLQASDFHFV